MFLTKTALTRSPARLHTFRRAPPPLKSAQLQNFSVLASLEWDPDQSQSTLRSTPFLSNSSRTGSIQSHHRSTSLLQFQQVRHRRHDRSSAFSKPRPKTKKQRQAYNRKMKKIEDTKAKHSAPGSQAGPRRQFIRERRQQLLELGKTGELALAEEDEEYGLEDALMEDILGNTAYLTSQPTPEPVHLGRLHKKFYNEVADQMDSYREAIDAMKNASSEDEANELMHISAGTGSLPSDKSISLVLRAYRDRHGTRHRPIGIVAALQHILKDLGVPTIAFGEYTYTTLLTCCRTPKEARRIMKLMTDQQHPISAYSWSILVDIHSKLSDFEGCAQVIKEMAANGVPPTQAAYTSLLAACYKVCNDGRIPHSIRAKAGKLGWQHWQEMRIVGIEADTMAYGAIIRLCSARGQAERAISLLEEMNRFDVKPTTLCFSSALRAVAKSHEIGIRYERGSSRKQLRRELFAAHHGKMARQIVIMAESAEVEQDEGFVSALMLCSAAAGDSATAKAVYLAAEVRRMDHLRTIGPNAQLMQLRGESAPTLPPGADALIEEGASTTANGSNLTAEGGALQQSSSSNATKTLVGQHQPTLSQPLQSFGEREYGKDTRALSALLRSCGQAMGDNGIGTIWAGRYNQGYLCENSLRLITTRWEPSYDKTSIPSENSTKVGISSLRRYDEDGMDEDRKKGAARKKFRGLYLDDDAVETIDNYGDKFDVSDDDDDDFDDDDFDFDDEIVNMNSKGREDPQIPLTPTSSQGNQLSGSSIEEQETDDFPWDDDELDEAEAFKMFYAELKEEAQKNGVSEDLSEEDARELFEMMQLEFAAAMDAEDIIDVDTDESTTRDGAIPGSGEAEPAGPQVSPASQGEEQTFQRDLGDDITSTGRQEKDTKHPSNGNEHDLNTPLDLLQTEVIDAKELALGEAIPPVDPALEGLDDVELAKIEELREALPGMPSSRLRKVLQTFESSLAYPSMLSLVPILRETMPDHVTTGWLRKMNARNAEFVMQKATSDNVVDAPLLNSMLQVKANAGSLDEAIRFHQEEFRNRKQRPTAYSDRLVLQMLVSNNRLPRALAFKEMVEKDRRTLDIQSYGTLVDYYARHHQMGSGLLMLRECIRMHGAPPGEKHLNKLRLLTRKQGLDDEIQLKGMIGEDPIEWLRHGENHLKREKSKKGRRNVQMAYNRILN